MNFGEVVPRGRLEKLFDDLNTTRVNRDDADNVEFRVVALGKDEKGSRSGGWS
jgi:hypothetical protein